MEATAFLAKIDGTRMIPDIVGWAARFCYCCCKRLDRKEWFTRL